MQISQTIEHQMPSKTNEKAAPSRHHHRKIQRADVLVGLISLVVIIPLLFTSGVIIYFQRHQLNLPGVQIYDQNVGMMSTLDTTTLVDNYWNQSKQINLHVPLSSGTSYLLSPAELGLWVDPGETAQTAYRVGRDVQPFQDVLAALQGEQQLVMPVLYYDETIARQTLEAINESLSVQPQNAKLAYQDSEWIALPGSEGQTLDVEATLNDLYANAFNILVSGSLNLYTTSLSPDIADLSPVLDDIAQVAAQEFHFQAYDPITDEHFDWVVPIEVKQNWISVDPDTHQVGLEINAEDIEGLLVNWEESLGDSRTFENTPGLDKIIHEWEDSNPVLVTIHHAPTTYTVSAGESLWAVSLKLGMPMWHIMDANEGLTADNISAGMVLTIPSKNILLPYPVVPEKRILIDIGDQTMTVYENGQVRNHYIVSTGMSNSPTMAGIFQIQSHEINAYASNWDLWMPHFMGIYEAWPGFMNGIHGLPLLSGGGRLWASSLGSPASYGCIILDLAAAEDLYFWAEEGVVVEITH